MTDNITPPSQAARDHAADLWEGLFDAPVMVEAMRAGKLDNHRVVQAFAKILPPSTASLDEQAREILADAYEKAGRVELARWVRIGDHEASENCRDAVAIALRAIKAALSRSASTEPAGGIKERADELLQTLYGLSGNEAAVATLREIGGTEARKSALFADQLRAIERELSRSPLRWEDAALIEEAERFGNAEYRKACSRPIPAILDCLTLGDRAALEAYANAEFWAGKLCGLRALSSSPPEPQPEDVRERIAREVCLDCEMGIPKNSRGLHEYADGKTANCDADAVLAILASAPAAFAGGGVREAAGALLDRLEDHEAIIAVGFHAAMKPFADRLRAALAQTAPALPRGDDPVFAFLLGEGPLEGQWFDETAPKFHGKFWWRKHLLAALSPPQPSEAVREAFMAGVDYAARRADDCSSDRIYEGAEGACVAFLKSTGKEPGDVG